MKRVHVLALSLLVLIAAGCAIATVLPDGRVLFQNGITKIYDPSSGVLRNASIPASPRAWNTSTLLQDGHVLLAGGFTGNNPLGGGSVAPEPAASGSPQGAVTNTASLYDPASDSYAPTGSMAAARILHTATLLQDGKVLVTGGSAISLNLSPTSGSDSGSALLASAEIYDPAAGTFSPTGDLVTGRSMHTATLLPDGKVLIVGGVDKDSNSLASAELYDPQTGTFTATGSLSTPRAFQTATSLQDGKVLIVGGSSSGMGSSSTSGGTDLASQSAEIYDPASGTFTKVAKPLLAARVLHTATLLQDGKVLIVGGVDESGSGAMLTTAELFDPATGSFTKTGDTLHGHAFHAAALLPDGKVIIAGFAGSLTDLVTGPSASPGPNQPTTDPLGGAEIYDPATGTWSDVQVEPMPSFALPSVVLGTPVLEPSATP